MLFLLNNRVVDVDIPEARLARRWKTIGCGDPYGMRARHALEFTQSLMCDYATKGEIIDEDLAEDLAALLIAKTGANAVLFPSMESAEAEPRLTILPEAILESLKRHLENGEILDIGLVWPLAA